MKNQLFRLSIVFPGFTGRTAFLVSYCGIGGSGVSLSINDVNAVPAINEK